MTLLTAMLDFTDTGEIGLLVSEPAVAAREAAIWTAPSFLEGVTSGKVGTHDFTESASR